MQSCCFATFPVVAVLLILRTLPFDVALAFSVNESPKRLLILGFGPVARAVSRAIEQANVPFEVTATSRQAKDDWTNTRLRLIHFSSESIQPILESCTHLLVTIPAPKEDEDISIRHEVAELASTHLGTDSWVGLVSTTGLYGNHDNAWVTEETECEDPDHPYLSYEETWRKLVDTRLFRIFRCGGLYGPERSALHTVFKNGYKIMPVPPAPVLTNRIHEDDVGRAIVASMLSDSSLAERIYNLADDKPEARAIVMRHAVELLESSGVAVPDTVEMSVTNGRRSSGGQKRVSNERAKLELVGSWAYPTYKEGLAAILELPSAPWWQKLDTVG